MKMCGCSVVLGFWPFHGRRCGLCVCVAVKYVHEKISFQLKIANGVLLLILYDMKNLSIFLLHRRLLCII